MAWIEGMDDLPFEFDEGPGQEQQLAEIKAALPQLCDAYPWIPRFLLALRNGDTMKKACELAGINRQKVNDTKNAYSTFARACADAVEDGVDELEAAARSRALGGSDALIKFLLQNLRPQFYDRRLPAPPGAVIQINFNGRARNITSADELTNEELEGIVHGEVTITGDVSALFPDEDDNEAMGDDEDAA